MPRSIGGAFQRGQGGKVLALYHLFMVMLLWHLLFELTIRAYDRTAAGTSNPGPAYPAEHKVRKDRPRAYVVVAPR